MQTSLVTSHETIPAPDTAALTITGLLQSVATELTIFVITAVIAVVMRHSRFYSSSSCAAAAAASVQRGAARTSPSNSPPRAREGVAGVRRAEPRRPLSSLQAKMTEAEMVEEIVACSWSKPSKAFNLYSDLRVLNRATFVEAVQRSKHSAEELYSALLSGAGRGKRPQLVKELFDDMQRLGVSPTLALYESAMRLLAGQHCYKEALDIYKSLEAAGLQASPVTLGCLVNFAAELGDLDLAISFFDRLSVEGVPNIRAYTSVLRVLSKRKDWNRSLEIYRDCQARGAGVDGIILNITLATGVAAGALGPSKALLQEASETTPVIVDVISFNTVLKGCAQRNDLDAALAILARIKELGLSPNAITYNTAMDAAVRCSERSGTRRGAADEVWRIYAAMRSAGLRPDKFTCSTLVKGVPLFDATQLSTLVDALEDVGAALPRLANALDSVLDRVAALRTAGCDKADSVAQRALRLMEVYCA